jgi:hypothetical protein
LHSRDDVNANLLLLNPQIAMYNGHNKESELMYIINAANVLHANTRYFQNILPGYVPETAPGEMWH